MTHDGKYFRQRAAEARASAFRRDQGEDAEIAGQLALAYSALARRQVHPAEDSAAIIVEAVEA